MSSAMNAQRASQAATALDSVHILVCSRTAASRNEAEQLLSQCSYKVTTAKTTRETLELLHKWEEDDGGSGVPLPALILKEHDPDAHVDARKLLRCMKDCHKRISSIPVVVMSDRDDRETVLSCLQEGAADYLIKPLRVNELRNLWTRVCWKRINEQARVKDDGRCIPPSAGPRAVPPLPDSNAEASEDTKCDNEEEPTSREGSAPDAERNGSDGHDGKVGNGRNSGSGGNGDSGNNRNSGTYRVERAAAGGNGDNGNNGASTCNLTGVKVELEGKRGFATANGAECTAAAERGHVPQSKLPVHQPPRQAPSRVGGSAAKCSIQDGCDGSGSLVSSHGHALSETHWGIAAQEVQRRAGCTQDGTAQHPLQHKILRPKAQHLADVVGPRSAQVGGGRMPFGRFCMPRGAESSMMISHGAGPSGNRSSGLGGFQGLQGQQVSGGRAGGMVEAGPAMAAKGGRWPLDKGGRDAGLPDGPASGASGGGGGGGSGGGGGGGGGNSSGAAGLMGWPWNAMAPGGVPPVPAATRHHQQQLLPHLQQQWLQSAVAFNHPYAQMQLAAAIMQSHLQLQLQSQYGLVHPNSVPGPGGGADVGPGEAGSQVGSMLSAGGRSSGGGSPSGRHPALHAHQGSGMMVPPEQGGIGFPQMPPGFPGGMPMPPGYLHPGRVPAGASAGSSGAGGGGGGAEFGAKAAMARQAAGLLPDLAQGSSVPDAAGDALAANNQSRKQKVDKYREKKKKRKMLDFEKMIRYPKRMEIANRRPRRKGMFVSRKGAGEDMDCDAAEMDGHGKLTGSDGGMMRGDDCSSPQRGARLLQGLRPSSGPPGHGNDGTGDAGPGNSAGAGRAVPGGGPHDGRCQDATSKPPEGRAVAQDDASPGSSWTKQGTATVHQTSDGGVQATGGSASGSNESPDDVP